MLRKFVYWTGFLDFLVGAAVWAGALANPQPAQFVPLMTLGTFLCMAAACLMWASQDLAARYPVVFWQGLVRATAVGAVLYAVPRELSETWEYGVAAFDGVIGVTYILGSVKVSGLPLVQCLLCRPAMQAS